MTASFGRLVGKRRAFYPVVAGIVLYTLLVGADASVMRAAIMGLLVALANYLNRRSLAIVSLFAAGLLMTALNPLTLWDVGFQLSFLATLSLVLFATPMTERFERLMARLLPARAAKPLTGFLNDALIVTLAAQILTLPLIAHYFGRLSVVSPLANLLVLPVQPAVMIWGGAGVIVSLLSTLPPAPLSTLLSPSSVVRLIMLIPWLALHWTVAVVQTLAALPFASASVNLSAAGLIGYYALLAVGMLVRRPSVPLVGSRLSRLRGALGSSKTLTSAATLLLAVCPLLFVTLNSLPDGKLHVHFLDVGQGEAVLIVTPDGQQVLVDGGASPTALLGELGRLMPFYDRKIDLVVLTHAGDERLGGLLGLAQRYQIGQVVQAPFPYPSAAYGQWLRELQEASVPIVPAEAGMRLRLGYGAALDVLNPGPEPALGKDGELDLKANSLVLRLSWGRTSVLLLGDATRGVQEQVVKSGEWRVEGEETVVKVPDGGRQAAFSQKLLEAIGPQQAVVFAEQDDRYRDLAAGVEEAWKAQVGAAGWHRTDLEGTVSFASNGERIVVEK